MKCCACATENWMSVCSAVQCLVVIQCRSVRWGDCVALPFFDSPFYVFGNVVLPSNEISTTARENSKSGIAFSLSKSDVGTFSGRFGSLDFWLLVWWYLLQYLYTIRIYCDTPAYRVLCTLHSALEPFCYAHEYQSCWTFSGHRQHLTHNQYTGIPDRCSVKYWLGDIGGLLFLLESQNRTREMIMMIAIINMIMSNGWWRSWDGGERGRRDGSEWFEKKLTWCQPLTLFCFPPIGCVAVIASADASRMIDVINVIVMAIYSLHVCHFTSP